MNVPEQHRIDPLPQADLRPPSTVMRLDRLGSFFSTRLSFLRVLLRDIAAQKARVVRRATELDDDGYGHAVLEIALDGHVFSLIAYSEPLDAEARTDRVIAQAWDACFVLYDGRPDATTISEIRTHAIRQEAGRYDERVLVLSRANKSVRLFDHVVAKLASGEQPDRERLAATGYLMRTTAVYGNGKFGLADRATIAGRPGLSRPFRLEMLTVFLIREFVFDLVDHVAKRKGGSASVPLASAAKRTLGIGNSTGLGMAPFLVGHPALLNNWMMARETALARVRAIERPDEETRERFAELLGQATAHLSQWNVDDAEEQSRIVKLRTDFDDFLQQVEAFLNEPHPFDAILRAAERETLDLQELLVALVLEPHGDLIDWLADCMDADEAFAIDPTMRVGEVLAILDRRYDWVGDIDFSDERSRALSWYVSEEKLEPRLGAHVADRPEFQEMPHDVAHKIASLRLDLMDFDADLPIAHVLLAKPEHRFTVRRAQIVDRSPYGEIRDNLVAEGVRPIDLLRCKLSFFGANRFDPRSDRWTRITLYAGAPTADELNAENCGDCFLPAA